MQETFTVTVSKGAQEDQTESTVPDENIKLYGNQLVINFLLKIIGKLIAASLTIGLALWPVGTVLYAYQKVDDMHMAFKEVLGPIFNVIGMNYEALNVVVTLFTLLFLIALGLTYFSQKVIFIRDFAIYETMLSLTRRDKTVSMGWGYRMFASKPYVVAERCIFGISILATLALLALPLKHVYWTPTPGNIITEYDDQENIDWIGFDLPGNTTMAWALELVNDTWDERWSEYEVAPYMGFDLDRQPRTYLITLYGPLHKRVSMTWIDYHGLGKGLSVTREWTGSLDEYNEMLKEINFGE